MAEYVWNEVEPRDQSAPFESGRFPYRAVVPAGWSVVEFSRDGYQLDIFVSAADEQAISVVFLTTTSPRIYEETEQSFLKGKRVESFEPIVVAGAEGRLYRTTERRLLGKAKAGFHVTLPHGPYVWQIEMSAGKRPAPDEAVFRAFLADFEPVEVLLARDDPSGNVWALEPDECFMSLPLLIEPRKVVEFWGGLDGFKKVGSRDEPHTGMVLAKFAEIPPEIVLNVEDPAFGGVLCLPIPGADHPPGDVKGVLVLAHAAGPYTGPHLPDD